MSGFLDAEIDPAWCLGSTWRCTPSEATGLWSVVAFYSTALAATFIHSALLRGGGGGTAAMSSARRRRRPADSGDQDLKALCKLVVYFFTFATGCLMWALGGVRWVHPVQSWEVQLAGSVVMAICAVLFVLVHVDMGDNWSPVPERKENHQLVTRGTFRWARHPMYAVFLWAAICTCLATLNWLIAWCVFGSVAVTLPRINAEEEILIDLFGDRYLEYCCNVSALGPPWQCLGYDKGPVSTNNGRKTGYKSVGEGKVVRSKMKAK